MKKLVLNRTFLAWLLLVLSAYFYLALGKSLPLLTFSPNIRPVAANNIAISWPRKGQAAVGSLELGVLAESTKDIKPSPTASIAKVITALMVLEKYPILPGKKGPSITLTPGDVELYKYYSKIGGSNISVISGEQLTEYQALQAMLLPSANNMADSLAIWAFGSTENYTIYANSLLKKWGLNRTSVADASGFSDQTISTPSDLVKIGQRVFRNPILAEIVGTKRADIPNSGVVNNTNILLGSNGVVGIKTGNTDEAGGCLLFAANKQLSPDHVTTIIGAVQGSDSLATAFLASTELINSSAESYGEVLIARKGDKIGSIDTKWGKHTDVITQKDLIIYGWKGSSFTPIAKAHSLKYTIDSGQDVGTLTVGNTSVKLISKNAIHQPSIIWRISHYF
jgi:serine-type D-Ala-D-Ala carboxypeptidase (penicillin-binding protein 5/6)